MEMAVGAQPIKDVTIEPLTERKAWKALKTYYRKIRGLRLRKLFAADAKRRELLTAEALGIFLDYSKNRITDQTLKILIELAEESGLRRQIDAMFRGERINVTENRTVLHVALRAPKRVYARGRKRCLAKGARDARPNE